mgnify:FL=1
MQYFNFCSMQDLKRRAKACKETHAHLTQAQRLDLVARRDFSFNSFNQARKLRHADIEQHVEDKNGLAVCRYCGLHFDQKSERREHFKRHEQYEEAVGQLGFQPMDYRRREDRKAAAWKQTYQAESVENKAKAYIAIFNAWFHRSIESAINHGYWRKHPDFPSYVSMMLSDYEMPAEPLAYLTDLYGVRPGHIKAGESYWYP